MINFACCNGGKSGGADFSLFLVMLYFSFPMSTGAHSDSTEVMLMPVCVSWQHTAIHPSSGEPLLRNYTHIWQQAIPMSPSKQATKACRSKQKNSLFPGSRGRQWLQVLQYWVVIWTWLHFPETHFSPSQPLPGTAGIWTSSCSWLPCQRSQPSIPQQAGAGSWKHCGLFPSYLPSELISSLLCRAKDLRNPRIFSFNKTPISVQSCSTPQALSPRSILHASKEYGKSNLGSVKHSMAAVPWSVGTGQHWGQASIGDRSHRAPGDTARASPVPRHSGSTPRCLS